MLIDGAKSASNLYLMPHINPPCLLLPFRPHPSHWPGPLSRPNLDHQISLAIHVNTTSVPIPLPPSAPAPLALQGSSPLTRHAGVYYVCAPLITSSWFPSQILRTPPQLRHHHHLHTLERGVLIYNSSPMSLLQSCYRCTHLGRSGCRKQSWWNRRSTAFC